jgi:hypothetical protein
MTKDQVGFIEVVENAITISQIHHDKGVMGALDQTSISDFLKKYNQTEVNMKRAKDNFLK